MIEITKPFIIKIQKFFNVEPTGEYDSHTEAAVKNFQYMIGDKPTGKMSTGTYNSLCQRINMISDDIEPEVYTDINASENESECTTDQSETYNAFDIEEYLLPPNEYVSTDSPVTNRDYIFLHFTAGWDNPYKVIGDWRTDTRGRIATHFVVGGINIANHSDTYDGKILRCIPWDRWAYHLGNVNAKMHKESFGIEICNFGQLTERNGKFFTYTGREISKEYVSDLGFEFKGHRYWHKFTEKQLDSTRSLLILLSRNGIDLKKGLVERIDKLGTQKAFEFSQDAMNGKIKGVLSHTNVSLRKTDVAPQPELIEMLKSL